jgi:hypothetical protein
MMAKRSKCEKVCLSWCTTEGEACHGAHCIVRPNCLIIRILNSFQFPLIDTVLQTCSLTTPCFTDKVIRSYTLHVTLR